MSQIVSVNVSYCLLVPQVRNLIVNLYPIHFGLLCDFRNDPRISSLLLVSPNGQNDVHGSLDVLPSSQHLSGNGHWETLELYLVRTFILCHECSLRYSLILLSSDFFFKS